MLDLKREEEFAEVRKGHEMKTQARCCGYIKKKSNVSLAGTDDAQLKKRQEWEIKLERHRAQIIYSGIENH